MMTSRPMFYFFTEKPARWFTLVLLLPLLSQYFFNEVFDAKFSLCSVRCRHSYGSTTIPSLDSSIFGNRPMLTPDRCDCYQKTSFTLTQFLGSISWHETNPAPSKLVSEVCAADGRGYNSQLSACTNETYPLHGGSCGACSNEHDISVYHKTKETMSVIAYQCTLKYLLGGSEKSAFDCFQTTGLTNNCNQCWIDNMKCTASSCLMTCLWHNMVNNLPWSVNTTLNPCIKCDEDLCGPAFVKCAGANRRRAGIVSDISRPMADVWNRTAC